VRVEGKTWENTISATISTHLEYFASGVEVLNKQGYWSLNSKQDPSTFVLEILHSKKKKKKVQKWTAK
jgi:hypothetical protein